MLVAMVTMENMLFYLILMKLCKTKGMLTAVSMATKLLEVPDKTFSILT